MKIILFKMLILLLPFIAQGQQLVVQIDSEINFDSSSLIISEAGEDFTASVESYAPVYVSVLSDNQLDKKINPGHSWRIFIHMQEIDWNDDLRLEVKRTGTGSKPDSNGKPQISNGENYQLIQSTPGYFFNGKGEIAQIPLGFRISGFSVTMGAKNFESSLIFTVYDD